VRGKYVPFHRVLSVFLAIFLSPAGAQVFRPPVYAPLPGRPTAQAKTQKEARPNAPAPGEDIIKGIVQDSQGAQVKLRGQASVETSEILFEADEIDYDRDTGILEARGHVHFKNFEGGEELYADRVDYNRKGESGTFYVVKGSAPGKMDPRVGILTTGNPFLFAGKYAEKQQNHYTLYDGWMTNCTYPNPNWLVTGPKFDIYPNDHAIAYRSTFKLQKVPILFMPAFYKSMQEQPRRSGFLTPNIGNSSRRGMMLGWGYYWAINRSYDASYRGQIFTARGFAHTGEIRGKPSARSEFNAFVYGVQDIKGYKSSPDATPQYQGGYLVSGTGKWDGDNGWYGKALVNYLSSFLFRQSFTESFNEAVFSEVNSVGFITKQWDSYSFNAVIQRHQNFMDATTNQSIIIRRLPQIEFNSRDREIAKDIPVWFSWSTEAGLLRRSQAPFETGAFVERMDAQPQIMTALRWKSLNIIPQFSVRETFYGETVQSGQLSGQNALRSSQEFRTDFIFPTLEKIFNAPRWVGDRVKHVIEPRAMYRYVRGVNNFSEFIRFDETEILANTSEVEYSIANRFYAKRRDGRVDEVLSWELSQRRFFDPTFGGAVISGQRNVIDSGSQMTAYTFFDQPRHYSPIVSSLKLAARPGFGIDYRTDYDPFRGRITNTGLSVDTRMNLYFLSMGYSHVACIPLTGTTDTTGTTGTDSTGSPCTNPTPPQGSVLTPFSNQIRGLIGFGQENKRGWNGAFLAIYDFVQARMQYANTQVTYNTSCCAYSFQYRRFGFGTRNENQYRFAFVIANIGSFGTLKRQERLF
jgi:LPS-assembly protein